MTIKHKLSLLVSLVILLVILLVIARIADLQPLRLSLPGRTDTPMSVNEPSISLEEYINEVYGISFNPPTGWEVDSTHIDSVASAVEGFETGSSYVQLFGFEQGTNRQQKIEIYIQPADITPAEFVSVNKYNQIVIENGVQWFMRLIQAENSAAVLAESLVSINYPNVEEKYALVTIAGFTFNEDELSEYSESMKVLMLKLISTFKKS